MPYGLRMSERDCVARQDARIEGTAQKKRSIERFRDGVHGKHGCKRNGATNAGQSREARKSAKDE